MSAEHIKGRVHVAITGERGSGKTVLRNILLKALTDAGMKSVDIFVIDDRMRLSRSLDTSQNFHTREEDGYSRAKVIILDSDEL